MLHLLDRLGDRVAADVVARGRRLRQSRARTLELAVAGVEAPEARVHDRRGEVDEGLHEGGLRAGPGQRAPVRLPGLMGLPSEPMGEELVAPCPRVHTGWRRGEGARAQRVVRLAWEPGAVG
jgi:hypothetical protein